MTIRTAPSPVTVIGGGLAGCEAAWQLAHRGLAVSLYEMRPVRSTQAHRSDRLAELVCSNSMGSLMPDRALGILKRELLQLGSLLIGTACRHALPAGSALAIDREAFAHDVTSRIAAHPNIRLERREIHRIPAGPTIIATGPLTSAALTASIQDFTGEKKLYFYDAVAPIVHEDSIDMDIAFRQSRWQPDPATTQEDGDYINCPLDEKQYTAFVQALREAPRNAMTGPDRELERYFEGCLPIEVLADRGLESLAFGPLRPIGLRDPRTGYRPYAVVQLRQDNAAATLFNMVGFQTNVQWGAQTDILRMIPGLANARFARLGQMHRNTFICSPDLLRPTMQSRSRDDLFFAGQITGTEGYVGSTMGGLVCGFNMYRLLMGQDPLTFPPDTMIGALLHYITHTDAKHFQPMKANMGLLPSLTQRIRGKRARYRAFAARAQRTMSDFITAQGLHPNTYPEALHDTAQLLLEEPTATAIG